MVKMGMLKLLFLENIHIFTSADLAIIDYFRSGYRDIYKYKKL